MAIFHTEQLVYIKTSGKYASLSRQIASDTALWRAWEYDNYPANENGCFILVYEWEVEPVTKPLSIEPQNAIRIANSEPHTLNTADLGTQHEYIEWIDALPEDDTPASEFHIGQAVHTRFWGDGTGRIVSVSLTDWNTWCYEVERRDGRIVIEPELFLRAAPELETTLPACTPRAALTSREIEARLDTPDEDPDALKERNFWYESGDQLPKL